MGVVCTMFAGWDSVLLQGASMGWGRAAEPEREPRGSFGRLRSDLVSSRSGSKEIHGQLERFIDLTLDIFLPEHVLLINGVHPRANTTQSYFVLAVFAEPQSHLESQLARLIVLDQMPGLLNDDQMLRIQCLLQPLSCFDW